MFDTLETIREFHSLTSSGRGRPRTQRATSRLDDEARAMFDALDLSRYLKYPREAPSGHTAAPTHVIISQ